MNNYTKYKITKGDICIQEHKRKKGKQTKE